MLQIPTEELLVTDEDVFAAFQLDTPELKPVQTALDHGNQELAKKLLIQHMETRRSPQFLYDYRSLPLTPIDTDTCPYSFQSSLGLCGNLKDFCLHVAHRLMDDHIYILPGNRKRQVNLGKNWEHMIHFNFNEDMGKFHRSYLDMMVRGQFFESLCILYHETGDTKVLDFFEEFLQVYFRTYPLSVVHTEPSANRFQYTEDRDVMSVGWLAVVYTSLFYTRVPYEISYSLSFEILKRIWFLGIQFRRFDQDSYRPYNHHMWERGLVPFILGTVFPEIPAFTAMKDRGAAIVRRHILEDFNPSGGYSEHSIAYWSGAAVGEMLYRGIYLARLNNESLLDQETTNRMNATFHVLAMLCPPGPRYPSLGDNGGPMTDPILNIGCRTMKHAECEAILKIRTYNQSISDSQSPSITYDPSCNQDAPIHLPLDFCDQDAGFICSKSGYRKRDNYLLMSAKVNCGYSGHNHMDMLSLFLTMRGEEIIGEPYVSLMYHDVTMNSPQRGYMYNMASHNTVLAYGTPIVPDSMYANKWGVLRPSSPITAYFHDANGIYADAYHDGYTFCRHRREILFHRERGVLIADHILRGNRLPADHIQRWNFMPETQIQILNDHAALITKNKVSLIFLWSGAPHSFQIHQPDILVPDLVDSPDHLADILDVSFHAPAEKDNENITVRLNLLILDVSDAIAVGHQINHADLENLQKQVDQLNRQWNCPDSLIHFPKLLIPASGLNT